MKVSVVGVGYVGLVASACLAEGGNHVTCVDNDQRKIDALNDGKIPIYEPGLAEIVANNEAAGRLCFTTSLEEAVSDSLVIVIAVGTPSSADGSADISAVLEVTGRVAELMDGYRIIVTKSTVPVGTHRRVTDLMASKTDHPFDYVSNPEFLKEGSAVEDFLKPDRVIIGTSNPAVMEILKQLYLPFMRKKNRIICMDPASAELTKYAANCMLAARISFMNQLSELCEKVGADIEHLREGLGSDTRIGGNFLFPGVGFGGSCFPKDIRALIHTGKENGCPMTIVESVRDANLRQQARFADRILAHFGDRIDRAVLAVWGLAFKAKTDDIRESPAVFCVERLLEASATVRAHDPEAGGAARERFGDRVEIASDGYSILEGADALVVLTDWHQFRNPDFQQIATRLKEPLIFDGRNLYEPSYVKKQGIRYICIGRPT
jgi:UDPglucose 6-dehydrogenase